MSEDGLGTEAKTVEVERLAARLYWNMQRLDPDADAPEWNGLTDRERRFYRMLVHDLAQFEELLRCARQNQAAPTTQ